MTEMKSYSQAVTGVSAATGREWILSLGRGVFLESCGYQAGISRISPQAKGCPWRTHVTLWRWQEWAPLPGVKL